MDKQTKNGLTSLDSKNTIPLGVAEKWTNEWTNPQSSYNKQTTHTKCIAFNIPKKDFEEVLNESGVEHIRAYIGVETKKDNTFEEKLIIVGVDKNNNDMLPKNSPNKGSIYDFSYPCPSACDSNPNNPLMYG